jgi:hypothetical protein
MRFSRILFGRLESSYYTAILPFRASGVRAPGAASMGGKYSPGLLADASISIILPKKVKI